ncbi:MAG: tRNA (guanosine(46)-N7)-methyltransferase TrmB [Chthoniobacteraceae bacterium]
MPVTDESPYEIIPDDYLSPLRLAAIFPGQAPLEVDIGSGDGAFLVAMAARAPERRFIGIERLLGRVRRTARRANRQQLTNLRLLRVESSYAVRYLFPPASVSVFHVCFPDPWPKRRHWSRRLIQPAFLETIHTALMPGGELRVKTDDTPYFQHMREVFAQQTLLREVEWDVPPDYPMTDFEARYVGEGLPINRARLVKD